MGVHACELCFDEASAPEALEHHFTEEAICLGYSVPALVMAFCQPPRTLSFREFPLWGSVN